MRFVLLAVTTAGEQYVCVCTTADRKKTLADVRLCTVPPPVILHTSQNRHVSAVQLSKHIFKKLYFSVPVFLIFSSNVSVDKNV